VWCISPQCGDRGRSRCIQRCQLGFQGKMHGVLGDIARIIPWTGQHVFDDGQCSFVLGRSDSVYSVSANLFLFLTNVLAVFFFYNFFSCCYRFSTFRIRIPISNFKVATSARVLLIPAPATRASKDVGILITFSPREIKYFPIISPAPL
jgi:hypothetical protein